MFISLEWRGVIDPTIPYIQPHTNNPTVNAYSFGSSTRSNQASDILPRYNNEDLIVAQHYSPLYYNEDFQYNYCNNEPAMLADDIHVEEYQRDDDILGEERNNCEGLSNDIRDVHPRYRQS